MACFFLLGETCMVLTLTILHFSYGTIFSLDFVPNFFIFHKFSQNVETMLKFHYSNYFILLLFFF